MSNVVVKAGVLARSGAAQRSASRGKGGAACAWACGERLVAPLSFSRLYGGRTQEKHAVERRDIAIAEKPGETVPIRRWIALFLTTTAIPKRHLTVHKPLGVLPSQLTAFSKQTPNRALPCPTQNHSLTGPNARLFLCYRKSRSIFGHHHYAQPHYRWVTGGGGRPVRCVRCAAVPKPCRPQRGHRG